MQSRRLLASMPLLIITLIITAFGCSSSPRPQPFADFHQSLAELSASSDQALADAQALARRLGLPPEPDASGDAILRRMLPPGRFSYWLADRF